MNKNTLTNIKYEARAHAANIPASGFAFYATLSAAALGAVALWYGGVFVEDLLLVWCACNASFLALCVLIPLLYRRYAVAVSPALVLLFAAAVLWFAVGTYHATHYDPGLYPYFLLGFRNLALALGAVGVLDGVIVYATRHRTLCRAAVGSAMVYRVDPARVTAPVAATATGTQTPPADTQRPAAPANAAKKPPAGTTDVPAQTATAYRYPAIAPRVHFADLYGNEEFKDALRDDGRRWREDGKNGVLLFGPPGTGKSVMAEALAAELGLRFLKVTFGDLASKWVNQSTEQVVQMFKDARAQHPAMLFIDEVDAVLKSRDQQSGTVEEYERMVTTFLDQAVELRNADVLLVAATNYIDKLDQAAVREGRFDFRHEVPLPDAAARQGLLETAMRKGHCTTDANTMARLVCRWVGFNVPRLQNCGEMACEIGRERLGLPAKPAPSEGPEPVLLGYDDFYRALRKIQGRKGGAPEGAKKLSELFMDEAIADRLANLATQLAIVDRVEGMGGGLPKGVLFSGPPGTGKTATAMALARECGWSFISRTGKQLLDHNAVAALGREASDLRPAIVFIDEADDILGDRTGSPYKSATSDLLALIDGAQGTLADVVWIAATNHPESMDSAAIRGGRFGEKVAFAPPSASTAGKLVADWVRRKRADKAVVIQGRLADWVERVREGLQGMTPSDIYQSLEMANNTAIVESIRKGTDRTLTVGHVRRAAAELRGGRV